MSRPITSAMVTASQGEVLSPVLLAQIGFASGPLYAWTGYGTLSWNGNSFVGTGTLGKIDPSTDTSDLSSQGANFILEGVSPASLALAIGEMQQGLVAKLWLGCMDTSNALIADPVLIFSGLTDVAKIDESDTTATISITCENKLARLAIQSSRRFTSDDQAIDYPGDRGFDYVPWLQNAQITFG